MFIILRSILGWIGIKKVHHNINSVKSAIAAIAEAFLNESELYRYSEGSFRVQRGVVICINVSAQALVDGDYENISEGFYIVISGTRYSKSVWCGKKDEYNFLCSARLPFEHEIANFQNTSNHNSCWKADGLKLVSHYGEEVALSILSYFGLNKESRKGEKKLRELYKEVHFDIAGVIPVVVENRQDLNNRQVIQKIERTNLWENK